MLVSVKKQELLTITSALENTSYFGGDQEWYEKNWNREAGCGPTSAANITAYLAAVNESRKDLYPYDTMEKTNFAKHMEEMFQYVTPGVMGVNHVNKFTDGLDRYLKERKINLTPKIFEADKKPRKLREVKDIIDFVKEGLEADCPLAFLNLSRGQEKSIQGWHWITITAADITENGIRATASDEGKKIDFDLGLWYLTTKMHGGLIYYS